MTPLEMPEHSEDDTIIMGLRILGCGLG